MAAMARTLFRKYPFATNSLIYGSLYVGAEFSQQFLTKRVLVSSPSWFHILIDISPQPQADEKKDIDYPTIGRYAVMGTFCYSPTIYTWFVIYIFHALNHTLKFQVWFGTTLFCYFGYRNFTLHLTFNAHNQINIKHARGREKPWWCWCVFHWCKQSLVASSVWPKLRTAIS